MCGIAGIYNLEKDSPIEQALIEKMLGLIKHRGPDEFGIYLDKRMAMGNARLSIIDLSTGSQPISNENETMWIVFNGEIFNYIELRKELLKKGHRFTSTSDTEVIVHLYEEYGTKCVNYLNGQFAFAIWDKRGGKGSETLFLARDRVGIRPLYYSLVRGKLIFGSEIKSILIHPEVSAIANLQSLAEVFTFWSPLSPKTLFENIFEIPPGHFLTVKNGKPSISQYWEVDFSGNGDVESFRREEEWAEGLLELLVDATRIRLRADVPVGAYLSGGLDSSAIAALIRNYTSNYLKTFSISFTDPSFDEREHQEQMVRFLGTDHRVIECADEDISRVFPDVIWHTECPILRTSPAPMYLLSGLVKKNNMKVVLTGEGADEFFGGYNIFKETKIRQFWAKRPESRMRPLLLRRLYPYVKGLSKGSAYLESFFRKNLTDTDRIEYSHLIRWTNTAALHRFFSHDVKSMLNGYDPIAGYVSTLSNKVIRDWDVLSRAQYIEVKTFMSSYLLSSQGDRMLMANSVEGRFPFLDHRVIEFANKMPPQLKLRGLNEKYILKKAMKNMLPDPVIQRNKQPYRAPIKGSFLGNRIPGYVEELLSPEAIKRSGYFDPRAVNMLVKKAMKVRDLNERENMAIAGIISTQLFHDQFIENFPAKAIRNIEPLKVCRVS